MHSEAATAAAGPPLLPPGTRSRSHGFRVGKNAEFSVEDPIANSSRLPFPTSTADWSNSLCVTVASYGGTKSRSIREEQVVVTPRVAMLSLSCIGTPVSGAVLPSAMRRSASRAWASAKSSVSVTNALTLSSTSPIRSNAARVSSTELT